MGTPTRLPNGVSTRKVNTTMGNLPSPDPIYTHTIAMDMDDYDSNEWTVTASTGTTALTAGNLGLIAQTTAVGNLDIQNNTATPLNFAFVTGKQTWFSWRGKVSSATTSTATVGLLDSVGSLMGAANGVYFTKDSTGAVALKITASSTSTTLSALTTAADSTYVQLGFYYDGKPTPTMYAFVNDAIVASTQTLTNLPTANLGVSFGIQALDSASAKVLTTDYIVAANDR